MCKFAWRSEGRLNLRRKVSRWLAVTDEVEEYLNMAISHLHWQALHSVLLPALIEFGLQEEIKSQLTKMWVDQINSV